MFPYVQCFIYPSPTGENCAVLFILPSWVMQIEPQPMPTLRASTPASMRFFAWAAVTTRERQTDRNELSEREGNGHSS